MKFKYYNIAAIVVFLFSISFTAYGQSKISSRIVVKTNQLQKSKNGVLIDCNILLNGVEISTNNQLTLTPVIRSSNGQNVELAPVIINGNNRNRLYKRSLRLNGLEKDPAVHAVIQAPKKAVSLTIPYQVTVKYEPWMKNASVYLIGDLCGCAGSKRDYTEKLIAERIGFPAMENFNNYKPRVNFIVPPREAIKQRAENGEAYLIFERGKWEIIPNLFNNKTELAKIDQSLQYIKEESTTQITGVFIQAYASPEGKFDNNLVLSKHRAKALLDYVQTKHTFSAKVNVHYEGLGEDWTHLVELIKKDPKVENKEQVLKIIESVDIFDGREKQLMDLNGGRPYLYMLDKLFPLLRRSDYRIEYTVPSFSLEKAKQLLETKPSMVSLEEMYLIAGTYEIGSESFNHVFKIADKV